MLDQKEGKRMNTKPLREGAIMIHGNGVGTISYEMIRNRASELAEIDGREAADASQADWDEAERELTSWAEPASLESVPESERWNPISGTSGQEAAVEFDDNEDEEGRSVEERLVQAGAAEADHERKLAAARDAVAGNE
jgi:hypothetical protein